ncbi:interleukin-3 receptor subunit alpha [Sturnira hondurensis]|uniref:interleukin-3 receptor subunit alpha n=1 Tax=Sturnira hondurensis TaxID=192404 RepID=UPI00187A5117|nr:interleukin-3 receptor subunit alpha [Sturnira hondurensis]
MALLRLLLLLTPVCCALPTDGDLSPPITNLRLDPGNKRLTWDLSGNVSRIQCYVNGAVRDSEKNNRYCSLYVFPKCEAWNFTVHATVPSGKPFSAWIDYPRQEGNPRAAAEHLQCRVHDLHFLTCSWAVGAEAPRDVQYDFYLEDLSTTRKWPCPQYMEKEPGTHVQCRFANVSQLPNDEDQNRLFRLVVQGTSRHSRVPCSEIFTSLSQIEEFIAPNLTADCNKSLAVLQWQMSSHFTKTFEYELKIEEDSGVPIMQNNLSQESWILPNPGTFTVTIRAQGGQWSARQRFVCDPEDEARLYVWLIALTALLAVGAAILLCKKYSVLQKLFPPIPHMKVPTADNCVHENMIAWQPGTPTPEDCPVAEVQLVEGT